MQYVTAQSVTDKLGADWHGSGDITLSVTLANAWLISKRLPQFEITPDNVILAGALIAKEFANGNMLQGRTEGVLASKSVKADSVSVAKTFADGADGLSITAGEQQALLLLAQYTNNKSIGMITVPIARV